MIGPAGVAPPPETIPSTRITATDPANPQVFGPFGPYGSNIAAAEVSIDRTINGGLNSLASGTTYAVNIYYSLDGGINWLHCGGINGNGDSVVVKNGVTFSIPADTITVSASDKPFPANTTLFQVRVVASTPVRIAGSVIYTS